MFEGLFLAIQEASKDSCIGFVAGRREHDHRLRLAEPDSDDRGRAGFNAAFSLSLSSGHRFSSEARQH